MNESLLHMVLRGGGSILILIICSIFSAKVIIEKWIAFKSIKEDNIEKLSQKFNKSLAENNLNEALKVSYNSATNWLFFTVASPLASVYKHILDNYHFSKEDLVDSSYNQLDKEISRLEKGLGVLGTLGAIAPFIGLFGTVVGIINAFEALSKSDAQNYALVMLGISEALIATAAGLFVAIPSVMFYNYFIKRLKLSMPFFDDAIHDAVRIIKSEGKK